MPKNAQEWKDQLGLEELPDPEFLEALNGLENLETISGAADPATFVEMTPDQIRETLLVEGVGLALKTIRTRQGHTTRSAAQTWQLSPGRISQMEQPGANLELATLAELARRMGYRTRIVFEPVDGGPAISAPVDVKREKEGTRLDD